MPRRKKTRSQEPEPPGQAFLAVFAAGPAQTNGYLLADRAGGPAVIIDAPLGTAPAMARQAAQWGRSVAFLLNTHAHWDHVLDNAEVVRLTGAKFGIHAESAPLLELPQTRLFGLDIPMRPIRPDFALRQGDILEAGQLRLQVLEVPGHCPGSVALYEPNQGMVFTGDTLFAGSIGRTDLWGADHDRLLASIRGQLLALADEVQVYAGHGPVTTIGQERHRNRFLQG